MAHWLLLEVGWVNLEQVGRIVERQDGTAELLTGLSGTGGSVEVAGADAARVRDYLALAGRPGQASPARKEAGGGRR